MPSGISLTSESINQYSKIQEPENSNNDEKKLTAARVAGIGIFILVGLVGITGMGVSYFATNLNAEQRAYIGFPGLALFLVGLFGSLTLFSRPTPCPLNAHV